jgi:hypothetical protein
MRKKEPQTIVTCKTRVMLTAETEVCGHTVRAIACRLSVRLLANRLLACYKCITVCEAVTPVTSGAMFWTVLKKLVVRCNRLLSI